MSNVRQGPIAWMAGSSVAANLLMMLFVIGGYFVLQGTKKEVFPEFTLDTVTVVVPYPGASPEEVEQGIVLAVESAVNEVDGISEIDSVAAEGSATIIAEVVDEDDLIRVAQDIKNAVDRITSMPLEAEEPVVNIQSRRRRVVTMAIFGDGNENVLMETAEQLRDIFMHDERIGPVEFQGARDYEVHIEIPQTNLRRYDLTLTQVADHIRQAALELPGGTLETAGGELLVRLKDRRDKARDFALLPIISTESGAVVRLGDIAEIKDTFEDSNRYAFFDNKPAIILDVFRIGEQTPLGISQAVKEHIATFNAHLPEGLNVKILRDRSTHYEQRANLLIKNGLWGLLLVIVFLALFLDIRLAFWVAMGIPISFGGAFLLFSTSDLSINVVSMFAFIISLGLVVDDAIVVGENIYSYREKGYSPLEASIQGAREVAMPVTFSVLTNIAAFMPLMFVSGYMGKVFQNIPYVVISVFIISLIESLFILPAHLRLKHRSKPSFALLARLETFQSNFNQRFDYFVQHYYRHALSFVTHNRYLVLVVAVSVLLVTLAIMSSGRMGMTLFPRTESDYAFAQVVLPEGAAHANVLQIQQKMVAAAERVVADNGGAQLAKGIYTVINDNSLDLRVYLTAPDVRPISTAAFTRQWRQHAGALTGVEYVSFLSNRGGPGSGAALNVELSHRNVDVLSEASIALAAALAEFPNTKDIDDGTAQGKLQFDLAVNELGNALGLNGREVANQVRAAFLGVEAFRQQRGRNEITVRVRLPKAETISQYHLENLILRTPTGGEVLLRDVADFKQGRSYTAIKRHNGRRIVEVKADVDPPTAANLIVNAIKSDALPELQQRYPGLSYAFEGDHAEMRKSLMSLAIGLLSVLLIIYGLLAVLFQSYTQPLMVMSAIPFGIIGAAFGHLLMGYSLSVISLFGVLALAGVVVNDALVLISFANRLVQKGTSVIEAIQLAGLRRFRPVLLTTLTTFIGLAPMILETSRQARFLIPMAISLGFGIVFATVITLLLIPALYMIIDDLQRMFHGARAAKPPVVLSASSEETGQQ